MGEDDCGGIAGEGRLDHFPGVDAGAGEAAAEKLLGEDEAILGVEPKSDENFVGAAGEVQAQLGLDPTAYASTLRRIRRRLASYLLPTEV